MSILVRASPASATSDCNLLPKRECLYPAKSCSCSITHRDEARIFGKLTEAVLGIKCLHPLQIGPRCFPAVMWMAVAAVQMHLLPMGFPQCCSAPRPPSPTGRGNKPLLKVGEEQVGALQLPMSCRKEISCPAFHGWLHVLDLDLQPGCPCQDLPCHCHSSCKEVTTEQGYWNRTAPLLSSPQRPRCSSCPAGPWAGYYLFL